MKSLNVCPSCQEYVKPEDFFCHSCGTPLTSPDRPRTKEVKGYIQIIGTVEIVFGAMGLMFGILIGLFASYVPDVIREGGTGTMAEASIAEFMETALLVLAVFVFAVAVGSIWSGIKLMQYKNSGRIGTMVIGALSLFIFPVGTVFGIASLYILTKPEVEPLFI